MPSNEVLRIPPPYPPRRHPGRYDAPMGPRINDRIRITPIRLIDQNGEMIGIVETDDARRRAQDLGLDLVEIAPDVRPPVCRIMDFGKYKYETAKKEKASKSRTKTSELKEVRLGRSMKIDPHDVGIRIDQARRFLLEGHKVQIVQNFRGRELAHKSRGDARMADVAQRLSDLGRVELTPRLNGKRMSMIISPDRPKIEAYKRKHPSAHPEAGHEADHDDSATGHEGDETHGSAAGPAAPASSPVPAAMSPASKSSTPTATGHTPAEKDSSPAPAATSPARSAAPGSHALA